MRIRKHLDPHKSEIIQTYRKYHRTDFDGLLNGQATAQREHG